MFCAKIIMVTVNLRLCCLGTNLRLQLTVLWKLVEMVLMPKPTKKISEENKSNSSQGTKWSFAAGTNMMSGFGAKIERESKQTLNEFAKELRAFAIVDMSGNEASNDYYII